MLHIYLVNYTIIRSSFLESTQSDSNKERSLVAAAN